MEREQSALLGGPLDPLYGFENPGFTSASDGFQGMDAMDEDPDFPLHVSPLLSDLPVQLLCKRCHCVEEILRACSLVNSSAK